MFLTGGVEGARNQRKMSMHNQRKKKKKKVWKSTEKKIDTNHRGREDFQKEETLKKLENEKTKQ